MAIRIEDRKSILELAKVKALLPDVAPKHSLEAVSSLAATAFMAYHGLASFWIFYISRVLI